MDGLEERQKLVVSWRTKTINRHLENVLQEFNNRFNNMRQMTCFSKALMLLQILFWTAIYLFGSYLTFGSSVNLIQQHIYNPTSMQIINMINNTKMNVPNYTVCIQVISAANFFGVDDAADLSYSSALNAFFEDTTHNGKFSINSTETYSNETYIVVWNYLAMIYEMEFFPDIRKNPFESLYQEEMSDEFAALTNILVPKIESLNITIEQLKSVFDGKISSPTSSCTVLLVPGPVCKSYQFSVVLQQMHSCALTKQISYIGRDQICFSIGGQTAIFGSCGVTSVPSIIVGYDGRNRNTMVSLDFSGKQTPPDLAVIQNNGNVFLFEFDTIYAITINLLAQTKYLPEVKGVAHCSEDKAPYDCINDCMSKLISKKCGCTPLILTSELESVTKNCTFAIYTKCLNSSSFVDHGLYLNCKASCLPSCDIWNYDYEAAYVESVPGEASVILEFRFVSFEYVIFQESQESFGHFISALGGALAIWLGLDFVILIQFIFQPIMLLIRKCLANTDTPQDENGLRAIEQNEMNNDIRMNKLKKLIRKHFEIKGGGSKLIAVWIFEKLFWTAVYITGGAYTLYYCYTLCRQYLDETTFSHVAIKFNKSISLPPAILCIPIDLSIPIKLNELININGSTTDLFSYSNALESYLNNENLDKMSFLSHERLWSPIMLYIASQYISILQIAEGNTLFSDSTVPLNHSAEIYTIQWLYNNYFNDSSNNDEINALENVLEPKLQIWNVNREELQQKFGLDLSQMIQLEMNFYGSEEYIPLNNKSRLSYLGFKKLCFTLPLDTVTFSDELDHIDISLNKSTPSILGKDWNTGINFVLDFTAYLTESDQVENIHGVEDGASDASFFVSRIAELTVHTMGISGHYISISQTNGRSQCTTDFSKEVCQAKCRIKQIEKLCNCSPTTWPMLLKTADSNNCNLKEYKHCLQFNMTADRICQDGCLSPCEHWSYISNGIRLPDVNGSIWYSRLSLYVKDYTYLEFRDQFQITFSGLLASLGGALGICLGLDVRFIIRIFLTPLITLIVFILNRKMKKSGYLPNQATAEILKKIFENHWMQKISRILSINFPLLNEVEMLKRLITILLWTPYYLFGFVVTCKMCVDFYQQFSAGPTDFAYQFTKNDTIQLAPSVTICLPLTVTQNISFNNEVEGFQREIIMGEFYGNHINGDRSLLDNTSTWPDIFLLTTLSYISLYSNYEQLQEINNIPQIFKVSQPVNLVSEIFDFYDKRLQAANITINELRQKCGHEMRRYYIFNVQQYQAINTTFGKFQTLEISKTTYIGDSKICYNLPINKFSSTADFIAISIQRNFSEYLQSSILMDVDQAISFDLLGRDFINFDSLTPSVVFDSTILIDFGENVTSKMLVNGIYEALPISDGEEKCSKQTTLENCQNECRIETIQNACNCTPVSWPRQTSFSDGKGCRLHQYKNCLSTLSDKLESCILNCSQFCTRIRFNEQRSYNEMFDNDINATYLLLSMKSLSYILAQEELMMSFNDFIGSFGGTLGFWIGLDVVMIVQFFYSLVTLLICLFCWSTKFVDERKRVAVEQQRNDDVIELKSV